MCRVTCLIYIFECYVNSRDTYNKVCLTVIYKCVYYRELHKIQFGESAPPVRNLILAFEHTAQTDIVSGSLPVLATNSVRNLDASLPPKNYNAMNTQCVARLFVHVPYVGSLLKERGIHSM